MFKHYLKVALRAMWRQKSGTFIKLTSLTIGLVGAIFILLWVRDEYQIDTFHSKGDRLYQVQYLWEYSDRLSMTDFTHGPLAASLKAEVPEVEHAIPFIHYFDEFNLKVGTEGYVKKGYYVGADFFELFDFKLLQGSANEALEQKNSIAISERLAEQFFGSKEQAIGAIIQLEGQENLIVNAVFETIPAQSTLQFDFVMSYQKFIENPRNAARDSWDNTGAHTILTLKEGTNVEQLLPKINAVVQSKFEEPANFKVFLRPFSDGYLYNKYENGQQAGGRIEYVRLFSLIGLFLLLIACINFMNLATAQAFKRFTEIGVKKTLGVLQRQLIGQYLLESIVLATISMLLAIGLVWWFLPYFNVLTEKAVQFSLGGQEVLSLVVLIAVVGALAGSYPAFYLSSFNALKVLKGERDTGRNTIGLRRLLVIFQFAVAVTLIIGVTVVYQQIQFIQDKDLGYSQNNLIDFLLKIEDRDKIGTFVEAAKKLPGVENVSSGNTPINHRNRTTDVNWSGKDPSQESYFYLYNAYYDLPETMGMELKEGRTFSQEFSGERQKAILNEEAVAEIGIEDPIGKTITLWGQVPLEIIGVVKNFHFQSFHEPIQPLIFRFMSQASPMLIAKLESGREAEALSGLETLFTEFNPGIPFDFSFIDQQHDQLYKAEQKIASLSGIFSFFTIFIAILGLFGLALFLSEHRQKEIGIRKVLGATTAGIIALLGKDFLRLVLLATIIAIPFAIYFTQLWLDNFAYHINLHWSVFVLASLGTVLIAALAVSIQSIKAALLNPIDSLRNE